MNRWPLVLLASVLGCGRRPPAYVRRPARAFVARAASDLPPGPAASGRPGDAVLENDHVRAVIDQLPGGVSFALSGGNLVDLAPRGGHDELGHVFALLGDFPRQCVWTALATRADADGTARVEVTGAEPRTPGLACAMAYVLGPDDRALTLRTTLAWAGPGTTEVSLGDAIQWTLTEHWAPGHGFVLPRRATLPWVGGVGRATAYAYAAPTPLTGPHGAAWSNPAQRTATLAPGERVTYERRLGVAPRGDVARALAAASYARPATGLVVRVRAPDGPVAGARVVLSALPGDAPVVLGATDEHGAAALPVAPGRYGVAVVAAGRVPAPESPREVTVTAGPARALALALTAPSALDVVTTEGGVPTPARAWIDGLEGAPSPDLGPAGSADGARNHVVVGASGRARVPLAPGRYRVTATRGPEYDLATMDVTVRADGVATAALALARVVDTTGYVCGDFHQHQVPSLDAAVSLRDRVRADAAEGVEVAAATDHNVATDLADAVRAEGLARHLLAIAGDEVSTDAAARPIGHANLFPLVVDPGAARGGVPDLLELDQPTLLQRARAFAPGAVFQVNHPRAPGPTGMFHLVGLDPTTGRATAPFDPRMDAVEVWNGRWQASVDEVMGDWLALLRAGARVTATGNSDSHAVVTQEAGYPRTCVAVPDDRPGRFTAADVVRALRETRDVVVTDGPFLRVRDAAGRSAVGRTLQAERGVVTLSVTVEAPSWSAPDAVSLVRADGARESLPVVWTRAPGVVRGVAAVRVPVTAGTFVLFHASGATPLPNLVGPPALRPLGFTNPVWLVP